MFQSLLLVSSQITVGRKISEIERGYCAVDEPHYLEQFDGSARDALRFAEVEAHLFQQDAIGTEHLLLGAMHLKADYFPFLKYQDEDLEASLARVRATTEQVIGRGKSSLEAEMGFTSEAKQAIDEACAEGQRSIGGMSVSNSSSWCSSLFLSAMLIAFCTLCWRTAFYSSYANLWPHSLFRPRLMKSTVMGDLPNRHVRW
jgi:hypothetical protein